MIKNYFKTKLLISCLFSCCLSAVAFAQGAANQNSEKKFSTKENSTKANSGKASKKNDGKMKAFENQVKLMTKQMKELNNFDSRWKYLKTTSLPALIELSSQTARMNEEKELELAMWIDVLGLLPDPADKKLWNCKELSDELKNPYLPRGTEAEMAPAAKKVFIVLDKLCL